MLSFYFLSAPAFCTAAKWCFDIVQNFPQILQQFFSLFFRQKLGENKNNFCWKWIHQFILTTAKSSFDIAFVFCSIFQVGLSNLSLEKKLHWCSAFCYNSVTCISLTLILWLCKPYFSFKRLRQYWHGPAWHQICKLAQRPMHFNTDACMIKKPTKSALYTRNKGYQHIAKLFQNLLQTLTFKVCNMQWKGAIDHKQLRCTLSAQWGRS